MKNIFGKIMRVVAVIFMAMTAAINLLGGIGTSCAAFFTKNYPSYWILIKPVDYRWLYQTLVVTTLAVGVAGIVMTVKLVRGKKNAYRNTMVVLVIGVVLSATQYFTSLAVIGKAAPANIKFYTNVVTLILFLLLWIPGIRDKVDFSKRGKDTDIMAGGGLASLVAGLIVLSTPMWVGTSHIYMGVDWVNEFVWQINVSGVLLVVGGVVLLAKAIWLARVLKATDVKTYVPVYVFNQD